MSTALPFVDDSPRRLVATASRADRIFNGISTAAASVSLLIIGATGVFLLYGGTDALRATGVGSFLTTSVWSPGTSKFGVLGLIVGTLLIAVIALVPAAAIALGLALFVNEYAPARVRAVLVSAIDLLAAMPSLVFGIWGFFAFQRPILGVSRWMADHLSAIPLFRIPLADVAKGGEELSRSAFLAGLVVAMMIIPIVTSVSRDVMSHCPREQCEGALALGGSRWGMIRAVILPFARSGIVGAVLLGFGRALGETVAIALIVQLDYRVNTRVLTSGAGSIASWIASKFPDASPLEISALTAAGCALFLMTFGVNLIARVIVRRSEVAS